MFHSYAQMDKTMKRDMDLVRKILLALEAHPEPWDWFELKIDGHSGVEVSYHLKLISQAGLIEASERKRPDIFQWISRVVSEDEYRNPVRK